MASPKKRPTSRKSKRNHITVTLESDDFDCLHRVAESRGLDGATLARVWVLDRLDAACSHAESGAVSSALRAVIADSHYQAARIADLETGLRMASARWDESALGSRPAVPRSSGVAAPRPSALHEEIVAILKHRGGAMTASEIADAIRRRGRYEAPRSEKPVTGATVSTRVSNPYYRDLFRRENRRISLAEE